MALDAILLKGVQVAFHPGQILFLVAIETKLAGRFREQGMFG